MLRGAIGYFSYAMLYGNIYFYTHQGMSFFDVVSVCMYMCVCVPYLYSYRWFPKKAKEQKHTKQKSVDKAESAIISLTSVLLIFMHSSPVISSLFCVNSNIHLKILLWSKHSLRWLTKTDTVCIFFVTTSFK